ncbi:MAG: MBL fold metallo-hydrolase [Actinobacteria bacterium]|nr:MBL fold metallo-hydrolase [Actinomycetota bacterium]
MPVEIAPGVFRIESRLGSRRLAQWLLRGSEGALLLDTGVAGTVTETVAPALRELGLAPEQVVEVIDSHADVDHYGGNAEARKLFGRARLRAHPLDRPLIESWETIAAERYGWYRARGLDYPAETWRWLEQAAGPDIPLDGVVEAGERIDLGGLAAEVMHLPGHSRGHLGLLLGDGTALIADAAMGRGFLNLAGELVSPPPYLDLAAYRATIERLRELSPARLETAHFAPLAGAEVGRFLARSARLVDDLEAAIDRALDDGPRTLKGLLPECAAAVGPYPEMEVELARSIGAHLEAALGE